MASNLIAMGLEVLWKFCVLSSKGGLDKDEVWLEDYPEALQSLASIRVYLNHSSVRRESCARSMRRSEGSGEIEWNQEHTVTESGRVKIQNVEW